MTDRDLGAARLLFRGSPWPPRIAVDSGLAVIACAALAGALGSVSVGGAIVSGTVLLAVTAATRPTHWTR